MEAALQNTQIAHKFMCFIFTLKAFFKDEFKSGQSTYLIPCSLCETPIFKLCRDVV